MARSKIDDWTNPKALAQLQEWSSQGYNDKQIAEMMGISRNTFYNWKKDNHYINDTIEEARKPVVIDIEQSFIKECKGYYVVEETEIEKDGKIVEVRRNKKYMRPNIGGMQFFLKNKLPDKYQDKPTINIDLGVDEENMKVICYIPENNRD